MNLLEKKILDGDRISCEDAVALFSMDLLELFRLGDARRRQISPSEEVGFIIDRIINFTNICEAKCRFCAFHARADKVAPYVMTEIEILKKVGELKALGGSQVMLQGGLYPDLRLSDYARMVERVKASYPEIYVHSFSPAELHFISERHGIPLREVIGTLKRAGLDSVPGASDILVDRVRSDACPNKIPVEKWCEVMRILAENGMKSSATMTYGMGETLAERIDHLSLIRNIQDECGHIRAFIPWSFSPANTQMAHLMPETGVTYLKIVAIARIFLDNIRYIQAGWLTEGLKLAQIALAVGANDMGGILMEEVVVKATGIQTETHMDEMVHLIRNAGKIPILRDSAYQTVRRFL